MRVLEVYVTLHNMENLRSICSDSKDAHMSGKKKHFTRHYITRTSTPNNGAGTGPEN